MAAPAPVAKRGLPTGAIVGIVGGVLVLVLVAVAVVVGLVAIRNDTIGNDTIRLKVPGVAMEPTIRAGQTVTATKIEPGEYRPKRGDIVVFTAHPSWIPVDGDPRLIKRVIGLPGERLVCDPEGRWLIDGKPLDEPYLKPGSASPSPEMDIVVPPGRLWVMGDNRMGSGDSRTFFISFREIDVATVQVSAVSAVVNP